MSEPIIPFAGRRWLIETATIAQGKSGELATSPAECVAAATALDLLECKNFTFTYALKPLAGQRFHLRAAIVAEVVQASVVSLEPVRSTIEEQADSELVPEGRRQPEEGDGAVDILNAPVIETYADGRIDLGLIAFELLSVSLEPYPKNSGETLPEDASPARQIPSPFAALAALRKSDT